MPGIGVQNATDAGGTGEWHHYLHHQEELTDAGDDFDVGHVAS